MINNNELDQIKDAIKAHVGDFEVRVDESTGLRREIFVSLSFSVDSDGRDSLPARILGGFTEKMNSMKHIKQHEEEITKKNIKISNLQAELDRWNSYTEKHLILTGRVEP